MTAIPAADALALVRDLLTAPAGELVKAAGTGRRRGHPAPDPERVDLRVVALKTGPALQLVRRTGHLVHTENIPAEQAATIGATVQGLLDAGYAHWTVVTRAEVIQVKVTRKDTAFVTRQPAAGAAAGPRSHDRTKQHLIAPDDPLFTVLGADGDKRRQVEAFLRILQPAIRTAQTRGLLPADGPLRVVDLGCGNAYLTFAAHRYLTGLAPGTTTVGVERRSELVARSTERADQAGLAGLRFVQAEINDARTDLDGVDVVLALHACDTATDDALAQAVRWKAPVILAAPCCHHDIQRQWATTWQGAPGPDPYRLLTRHPILRERLADVVTDALRAAVLREAGWTTDVVEFIAARHTPRNALIRAVWSGAPATPAQRAELADLTAQWRVTPALAAALSRQPSS